MDASHNQWPESIRVALDMFKEGGVYKMYKSNIKEIFDPSWDWYFTSYNKE
jgi:hypothetical protein